MLRPNEVSVKQQLAAYQEADIVVQTHSAAAGNIPFMKDVSLAPHRPAVGPAMQAPDAGTATVHAGQAAALFTCLTDGDADLPGRLQGSVLISYVWKDDGGWAHGFAQHLCAEMELPILVLGVANGNVSDHLQWRREVRAFPGCTVDVCTHCFGAAVSASISAECAERVTTVSTLGGLVQSSWCMRRNGWPCPPRGHRQRALLHVLGAPPSAHSVQHWRPHRVPSAPA